MKRKAIFFSVMSILFSSLLILLFSSFLAESFDREAQITTTNAAYVNDLVVNLERYLRTALQISTYWSLESLVDSYIYDGFFTSGRGSFAELEHCLQYSSFSFVGRTDYCFEQGSGYSEALRSTNTGLKLGIFDELERALPLINISHKIYNVSVAQTDTYTLEVNTSLEVNITSRESSWQRYYVLSESVSMVGNRDPYWSNETYDRTIELYPETVGQLYQASFFRNNYSFIANFSEEGYVFRDASASSFFQVLDGVFPTSVVDDFSEFGYSSFIPGTLEGASTYRNNQTASVAHFRDPLSSPPRYVLNYLPSDLRRIDYEFLNTNQTFPVEYFEQVLFLNATAPKVMAVAGCCDDEGCDPMCR